MFRFIQVIISCIAVSGYLYPFTFTFFPVANTKTILALIGLIWFILRGVTKKRLEVESNILTGSLIAIFFGLICYISADINGTNDKSYAFYIGSFLTWLFGAYSVVSTIRLSDNNCNIGKLGIYLIGVSAFQCIIALVIDNNEVIKNLVNTYTAFGQHFFEEKNRLYGIGAALDPAGTRFAAIVVIAISALTTDYTIKKSKNKISFIIICFVIISIIGNMISRTTTTGILLSLMILVLSSGVIQLKIFNSQIKTFTIFFTIALLSTALFTFLYNADSYYYNLLRYGFEGFFSLVETGEFSTDSTDKLNNVMWIWPTDLKTWIIGSGIFGSFAFGTDIGYCRFILYCGIIGFSAFCLLFIYQAFDFWQKFKHYWLLFILLLALCFIIWIKVATDLMFAFAFFYWIIDDERAHLNRYLLSNENHLLYSSNT